MQRYSKWYLLWTCVLVSSVMSLSWAITPDGKKATSSAKSRPCSSSSGRCKLTPAGIAQGYDSGSQSGSNKLAGTATQAHQPAGGSFDYYYAPIQSGDYTELQAKLQNIRLLESWMGSLNQVMALPSKITFATMECKMVNAFYDRENKVVVLCLEMIGKILGGLSQEFEKQKVPIEVEDVIMGTIGFMLFHEFAHVLIDMHKFPIFAGEENAADSIAMLFLLNTDIAPKALSGVLWFFEDEVGQYDKQRLSDEHPLGPQRQANTVCLAYGKDPQKYAYLARRYLTPERSARCQGEYARAVLAFNDQLTKKNFMTRGTRGLK